MFKVVKSVGKLNEYLSCATKTVYFSNDDFKFETGYSNLIP